MCVPCVYVNKIYFHTVFLQIWILGDFSNLFLLSILLENYLIAKNEISKLLNHSKDKTKMNSLIIQEVF